MSMNMGRLSSVVSSADCRSAEPSTGAEGAFSRDFDIAEGVGQPSESKISRSAKDRRNARQAVQYAVATGRIRKPKRCRECREVHPLEGHHHLGYDKAHRLRVRWLCATCHRKEHGWGGPAHRWTIKELSALMDGTYMPKPA